VDFPASHARDEPLAFLFLRRAHTAKIFTTGPQLYTKNGLGSRHGIIISPAQKRAGGRAPVWGSEFTTKYPPMGVSKDFSL
jgi:hypothetical protein